MKTNRLNQSIKNKSFFASNFLLSLIVFSIFSVFGTLIVNAQNEKKTLTLTRTINPQLKIIEIKVGQQAQKFGESFDAQAEWVKNISFKLANISEKPIVYLKVNVNFPETRANGNLMSYSVSFGQRPGSKLKQNNPPLLFKPGETLEVLLEKEKDRIDRFIAPRQSVESIKSVELEISFIIFEDKTAWSVGSFMRQDDNNPDRYNPIVSKPLR